MTFSRSQSLLGKGLDLELRIRNIQENVLITSLSPSSWRGHKYQYRYILLDFGYIDVDNTRLEEKQGKQIIHYKTEAKVYTTDFRCMNAHI